jgi:hypothetical protein
MTDLSELVEAARRERVHRGALDLYLRLHG